LSVKIRLRRMGAKGRPFYRVVIADSRRARNGRFIEAIGTYDPNTDPATIKIDEEKALLWMGRGAQATDTTQALLKKQGIVAKFLASKGQGVAEAVEEAPAPVEEKKPAARKKKTEVAEDAPTADVVVEAPVAAVADIVEKKPVARKKKVEAAEEAPVAEVVVEEPVAAVETVEEQPIAEEAPVATEAEAVEEKPSE
jgi:small subunit ribosomal protein S16